MANGGLTGTAWQKQYLMFTADSDTTSTRSRDVAGREHRMSIQVPEEISREMAEWNNAVSDAMEVEGYSLYGGKENDRTLDSLIGVPFLIKSVTFRPGDITPQGQKVPRDYVSVECLIRPDHAHKFARKYVVFNDGSTGVYRQVVAALAARGDIILDESLPENGEANTTRYDVSFASSEGFAEFDIRLLCPEGLRKSDYKNSDGSEGFTWYLA
jgi:hypothetical protein